ncbi:MAG: AAA family ATPase [Bacillota bacterium]
MELHNKKNNEVLQRDMILERFQKGELNTRKTFKLLTRINEKKEVEINRTEIFSSSFSGFDSSSYRESMAELDELIGLEEVKSLIREYIAFLKVQKIREKFNLKNQSVVMHMIFKGNPGTGKTTVARIIGKIFSNIGYLEDGELIEAERADLVGEYIGHTAKKTKEMIEKSLGGVLFIDEAYALARGGKRDFGKEAIDTLVKSLEDHRDNLIVILAGYKEEMEYFLQQNPGLKSRFSIHLEFSDYSIEQLVKIAELMYKRREYSLSENSRNYLFNLLKRIRNEEGKNKGNARTVRNLVEKSIRHQAQRIIKMDNFTQKDLMSIKIEDLAGGRP